MTSSARESLPSVVHCFRAPVGGVFRHVRDLAIGQAGRGLNVGVICDLATGGEQAQKELTALAKHCSLGVQRVPMRRMLHPSDLVTHRAIARICRQTRPDVLHGHGAKGGAFARLSPRRIGAKVIYTPHGGVLHYATSSFAGRYYFGLERYLKRRTDGLIFASDFGARQFLEKIGPIPMPYAVVHNGLGPQDQSVIPTGPREFSFVFVGELRRLKGVDTLLRVMVQLSRTHNANLLVCGDGPDARYFESRVRDLGLQSAVTIGPPVFPVAEAFSRAKCVVIPSHAESFPYVVLEAAAAGAPLISTSAGGIPEIFGRYANQLVPPGDTDALATAMSAALENPDEARRQAEALATHVRDCFRIDTMVDDILALYQRVLAA